MELGLFIVCPRFGKQLQMASQDFTFYFYQGIFIIKELSQAPCRTERGQFLTKAVYCSKEL